jgi:hypothetical protein
VIGYPPSDSRVRDWFRASTYAESDVRFNAFLTALFEKTLEVVDNPEQIRMAISSESNKLPAAEQVDTEDGYPDTLPGQFRLYMTVGQTFTKQGDLRITFYNNVLERADEVSSQRYLSASKPTATYSYSPGHPSPPNGKRPRASSVIHEVSRMSSCRFYST